MKKKISFILVFTLLVSVFCISSYAYGTPPGLAKKGGLPPGLAKKENLPPGWANKVDDIKEEAVIKEKIVLKGMVKEVGINTLKVQMSGMTITLELEESVKIKINGKDSLLEDIKAGDEIEIKIDDQNKVLEINRISQNKEQYITGKLVKLEDQDKLIVKVNDQVITYKLAEDVKVYIHNQLKNLTDLKEGETIKFKLKDNKVTMILWKPVVLIEDIPFEGTIEGKLIKIESGSQNKISVQLKDETKSFVVDKDVEIEIDDEEENFIKLFNEIGNEVEIEVVNNKVVRIEVED